MSKLSFLSNVAYRGVPVATAVTGEWKLRLTWMGLLVPMHVENQMLIHSLHHQRDIVWVIGICV